MPDKKFTMSFNDIAKIIELHCGWEYGECIQSGVIVDVPADMREDGAFPRIRVAFKYDNKYLYAYAYKGDSSDMDSLKCGFLKKNWMLRYSADSIDMRYRPGEDWDVCGFIYSLYDRITWESLKGVDENA